MAEEIKVGAGTEKPKGHIRGIWAITIIVVIAILVGGGIWYWYYRGLQTQDSSNVSFVKTPSTSPSTSASASPSTSGTDETADWKDYSNSTYGFSVKYPAKATADESTPKQGDIKWMITFRDTTGCGNDQQCSASAFTVAVYDNPNKLNAMQWIEATIPAAQRDNYMISGITIDGVQGKRLSTTLGDEGSQEVIVQSRTKSNVMFVITLGGISPSLENTFSQFIDTFKFL